MLIRWLLSNIVAVAKASCTYVCRHIVRKHSNGATQRSMVLPLFSRDASIKFIVDVIWGKPKCQPL